MADILLEVCVDNAAGLMAAVEGGADRIELCSALDVGGLTPSLGLMRLAATVSVPVYAMIRPRAGDFIYSPDEVRIMKDDIGAVREAGLAGVVFGANLPDGRLDEALLSELIAHASGLGLTLHRAFDCTGPDFSSALETAIKLGFHRVLTSGGKPRAIDGLSVLEALFKQAARRIVIMPGSGVNVSVLPELRKALPLTDIHASCSAAIDPLNGAALDLGFVTGAQRQTSAKTVQRLIATMHE